MSAPHSPRLLTPTQRMHLTQIPSDMTTREVAYYSTLTPDDRARIARHRGPHNRLGFAMQRCALRFPGRSLTDLHDIPWHVLQYIARQIDVPESAFAQYGQRAATVSEHLREIGEAYGYRSYDWRAMRMLTRTLRPLALESDRGLPLAEAALDTLRTHQIIAPGITTLERLLWVVRQQANRLLVQRLTGSLTPTQCDDLDGLLHAVVRHGPDQGKTLLTWLRTAAGKPSARQLKRLLSRVQSLLEIPLPPFPDDLHRHRVRQLSRQA